MLRIWYSNRLEQLVDGLARNVDRARSRGAGGVLEPARILVPNWNIKRYLQLEIARRRGIAINLQFDRLRQFSADVALRDDESVLGRDRLQSLLFEALRKPEVLSGPQMAPVRGYLAAAGESIEADEPGSLVGAMDDAGWSVDNPQLDSRERRRFQLAGRVASLIEEYSFSRPEMLTYWPHESYMSVEVDAPERFQRVEAWQSRLWGAVFGDDGLLSEVHADGETTYRTLWDLYYGQEPGELSIPGTVHIFGLSYMARLFGRVLERFAEEATVHLYALNPCKEYWGDLRTGRHDEEHVFSSAPVSGGTMGRQDSAEWELESENPALRQWGRPGRDHFWMLQEIENDPSIDAQIDEVYPSPLFEEAGLLKNVQNDIRIRRGEDAGRSGEQPTDQASGEDGPQGRLFENRRERPTLDPDETIQFVRAPGVQREVETVARRIWEIIESDDEVDFQDVAVIVNHRRSEEYIPKLASAFERMRGVPYNLVDLSASGSSRIVEAVEMLLELPFGDFRRDELLKLLVHPSVRAAFPGVEESEWVEWCEQLNIIRGADRDDQRDTYIDADIFNWSQGTKRLILGTFMAEESPQSSRSDQSERSEWSVFEHDGSKYLPEEVNPGRAPAAARFVALAESLIRDVQAARQRTASLSEWAEWLARMVDTYITAEDDEDEGDLLSVFGAIEEVGELDVAGEPISYRAAHEFTSQKLEDLEVRRGQYLADGVVVSSFLPMRPIPFEYVFALGLGESTFPTTDPNTPLDLRTAQWERGDVGPRDQDRYMFLETLISTRKQLHLSWVGRDPTTGDPLEPSSVVRELQQMLELFGVDPEACTREPPLRRYDREAYFPELTDASPQVDGAEPEQASGASEQPGRITIDAEAFREAQLRALRESAVRAGMDVPELSVLREQLGGEATELLENRLHLSPKLRVPDRPPFIGEDAETGRRPRLRISVSQIQTFLETPLQGGARVRPGLREVDHDDPFDRTIEPYNLDILKRNVVGRSVFRRALEAPLEHADLEALYDSETERAVLRGEFPAGLFGRISRQSMVEMLRVWRANAEICGVEATEPAVTIGFGDRTERASQAHPAMTIPVSIEGVSREVLVDIHGTLQSWSPSAGLIVVATTSSKPKPKYLCRGHLTNVLLRAAEVWKEADDQIPPRVAALPREEMESDDIDQMRQVSVDWSASEARTYVSELLADMLGQTHDYLLPVELVDAYIEEVREAGQPDRQWLDRKLESMLSGYRTRGSSQYGPVDDFDKRGTPIDFEAKIRSRYRLMYPDVLDGEA
jgi:exodeoxyribonuclease V gamma subunit